jgi:hypothetical protein
VLQREPILQAEINKAFAHLNLWEFDKGWPLYAKGIGNQQWRERKFHFLPDGKPEPIWQGEPDAKLIITAEQGIGDQIAFMNVIPDMLAAGIQIAAIECYPKLWRLFQSSFPSVRFYPTQFKDPPGWRVDFTHSCSMSELQAHYRKRIEDYPRRPYIVPNMTRLSHWRKAFADQKRPRIGMAWTGGSRKSHGWRKKSIDLDTFAPVFDAFPDALFVNLEYKAADTGDYPIKTWEWATQTEDYEETAAMAFHLDAVVTVPTSINHLAGSMGVPVFCLMNDNPHFHYGAGMPYYPSVRLFKRDDLGGLLDALRGHFSA